MTFKVVIWVSALLTGMVATAADFATGGLYYSINAESKTATVTEVPAGEPAYSGAVIIPESVTYGGEKYTVNAIENKAFMRSGVTAVQIPPTVTALGDSIFYFAENLANVSLSVNLKLFAASRCNPSKAHSRIPSTSAFIFSARSGSSTRPAGFSFVVSTSWRR